MIVIGAGAIGLELGQLFARFGVRVTLVEALPRIAAAEEPEISEALTKYLADERMTVLAGVRIERVERSGNNYRVRVEANDKKQTKVYDLSALPRVTFPDPQIASVGVTEKDVSQLSCCAA
jgi:mercuric reductase